MPHVHKLVNNATSTKISNNARGSFFILLIKITVEIRPITKLFPKYTLSGHTGSALAWRSEGRTFASQSVQ